MSYDFEMILLSWIKGSFTATSSGLVIENLRINLPKSKMRILPAIIYKNGVGDWAGIDRIPIGLDQTSSFSPSGQLLAQRTLKGTGYSQ